MHNARAFAGGRMVRPTKRGILVCTVLVTTVFFLISSWPSQGYSFGEDDQMVKKRVAEKIGTLAAQLLDYSFVETPEDQQTKGQKQATRSFTGWLNTLLTIPPKSEDGVVPAFHVGDGVTCDAMRVEYTLGTNEEQIRIRLTQTVFLVQVVIAPREWPAEWLDNRQSAALALAQRLFKQADRINLRLLGNEQGVWFGEQIIDPGQSSAERGWIDTLRWWASDRVIGFVLLKSTGAGQAARVSADFQPNQKWFDLFEKPRYR